MSLTTLDNNGYRLINQEDLTGFFDTNFVMTFDYDFSSSTYKNNQTMCMGFDFTSSNYSNQMWTTGDCYTYYLLSINQIQCDCTTLKPYYYAIVNDYSRIWADAP
jgi:hypothetical protein